MTQQTVRQYLDAHFERVKPYDVRLISAHARSYCFRRNLQYGRVFISGKRYANAYDVEILALICQSYGGLRRKR
jgi:hypothetical protein